MECVPEATANFSPMLKSVYNWMSRDNAREVEVFGMSNSPLLHTSRDI